MLANDLDIAKAEIMKLKEAQVKSGNFNSYLNQK